MVGTSKILTVSYGTFSCTLEGFDDSFNTMKAIAEYFRGLAADDRYFGAEPPTPDAEMLAKIAEREISRRVDAHMQEDGIVLRAAAISDQTADDVNDAETPDQSEADRAAADAAEAEAARQAELTAQQAEAEAKAAEEAKALEMAKAEAVAKAEAEAAALIDAEASSTDTEILSPESAATAALTEGASESDVEETRDDASSSMLAAEGSAPTDSNDDSLAAKLQRIRAVVGNANDDPSNDATEAFLPQSEAPDVADFGTAMPPVADDDATNDAPSEADTDLVAEFDSHAEEIEADAPEAQEESTDGTDMISRVMARNSAAESDNTDAPAEVDAPSAEANTDDAPRARVVRMKRADFEKAVADGDIEATPAAESAQGDSRPETASDDAPNFGLLDGVDDLGDYLEDSDFPADDLDVDLGQTEDLVAQTVNTADEAANVFAAETSQVEDAALERLMSETDVQMQEPEGTRRRDAIAQLKAAVAAKEAARQVGETEETGEDMENAFRNDLSEVVRPEGSPRPRPVVRSGPRTERPRPAPLKLIAAQRVDLQNEDTAQAGPVVPRRVAPRRDEHPKAAQGSFADFAETMGANELPDLLEAAAAYLAFVKGAEEFSRPQILRRVLALSNTDFNREDGLRSFADLLKAGRFTKIRNGRFQVADDSRFNPERQAS